MICPNCKEELQPNKLYCPKCGYEIQIVGDFDASVEVEMKEHLSSLKEAVDSDYRDAQEKHSVSLVWPIGLAVVILIMIAAIGLFWMNGEKEESLPPKDTVEYYLEVAKQHMIVDEYEPAIQALLSATNLEPDNKNVLLKLLEVYFEMDDMVNYEALLDELLHKNDWDEETTASLYGRKITLLITREDIDGARDLLSNCNNSKLIDIYYAYYAPDPVFDTEEGNYFEIKPIVLSQKAEGEIYYTLDGTEPNEEGTLYTGPILPQDGENCIKAVFRNQSGMYSHVVSHEYIFKIDTVEAPKVLTVGGEYTAPEKIQVEQDGDSVVYFTINQENISVNPHIYTEPFDMPFGVNVFRFYAVKNGVQSEVITREYNLNLVFSLSAEECHNRLLGKNYNDGITYDLEGHVGEEGSRLDFSYDGSFIEDNILYFVFNEERIEGEQTTFTGRIFGICPANGIIVVLNKTGDMQYAVVAE